MTTIHDVVLRISILAIVPAWTLLLLHLTRRIHDAQVMVTSLGVCCMVVARSRSFAEVKAGARAGTRRV